jgi:IclR family acetate operon transcriptional repressor
MHRHTDVTDRTVRRAARSAKHGYAVVESVRCVAVAVPDTSSRLALSVSGPAGRVTDGLIERAVPLLTDVGKALSVDLS